MKHFSHSVLPVTLLAMASQATAQTLAFQPGEIYPLPVQGITTPAFTTSVAGQLTGHHLNDAVVLAGSRPVLVTAPGLHRSALPLPLPTLLPFGFVGDDVRDIAILRGGGEEGRDALVMVTGAGLWTWHMSRQLVAPQGGGTPVLQWVAHVNPLGTSVWAGAKKLRVADVNNDGIDDVLGIMSAERAIRCLQRDAAGTTWVITAAAHVRDFVVADLVTGGTPEIVAMTGPVTNSVPAFGGGLRVFAPGNSTDLARFPLVYASPVCGVLRAGATTGVVVAGSDGAGPHLHSFKMEGGPLVECNVIDVAAEVTAITTGKWETASEDVFLTYRTTSNPAVVTHANLTLGLVRSISLGSLTTTDNRAACLVADWNGDPAEPEVALHDNPLLLYPSTATGAIVLQQRLTFDSRFVRVTTGNTAFGIAAPPDVRPTHVQIERWGLVAGPSLPSGVTMANTSAHRELCALYNSTSGWDLEPMISTSSPAWQLSMRFVVCNGEGAIIKRWPARNAGVSLAQGWIAYFMAGYPLLELLQDFSPMPVGIIYVGITGDVVQPPGGPDSDDDDPPKPDPSDGG